MKKDDCKPTVAELRQEMQSTGKYCEPCRWAAKGLRVKFGTAEFPEEIRVSFRERRVLWPMWLKQGAYKAKVLRLLE